MLTGLLLVLRFLLILLFVRLLVRGFVRLFAPRPAPRSAPPPPPPRPLEDLVRDRVCNTFLPRSRAVPAVVAGHEEHFCSTGCRDRALVAVSRAS